MKTRARRSALRDGVVVRASVLTLDASYMVFTLVTRGHFLTSASKFNIAPNGGNFDISPQNDRASPNVKTPQRCGYQQRDYARRFSQASRRPPNIEWSFMIGQCTKNCAQYHPFVHP